MTLEIISEFILSSQNCSEAVHLFENCYENIQTLQNLETVTKLNDIFRLTIFFNEVENSKRNLTSLGVNSDNYRKLLVPMLN